MSVLLISQMIRESRKTWRFLTFPTVSEWLWNVQKQQYFHVFQGLHVQFHWHLEPHSQRGTWHLPKWAPCNSGWSDMHPSAVLASCFRAPAVSLLFMASSFAGKCPAHQHDQLTLGIPSLQGHRQVGTCLPDMVVSPLPLGDQGFPAWTEGNEREADRFRWSTPGSLGSNLKRSGSLGRASRSYDCYITLTSAQRLRSPG